MSVLILCLTVTPLSLSRRSRYPDSVQINNKELDPRCSACPSTVSPFVSNVRHNRERIDNFCGSRSLKLLEELIYVFFFHLYTLFAAPYEPCTIQKSTTTILARHSNDLLRRHSFRILRAWRTKTMSALPSHPDFLMACHAIQTPHCVTSHNKVFAGGKSG